MISGPTVSTQVSPCSRMFSSIQPMHTHWCSHTCPRHPRHRPSHLFSEDVWKPTANRSACCLDLRRSKDTWREQAGEPGARIPLPFTACAKPLSQGIYMPIPKQQVSVLRHSSATIISQASSAKVRLQLATCDDPCLLVNVRPGYRLLRNPQATSVGCCPSSMFM